MKEKVKGFFKNNYKEILILIFITVVFNIRLPFYILMPGGTLDISDKITVNGEKTDGLSLLYVGSARATIPTYLLSFINNKWELEKVESQQISDESFDEIDIRNKVMLTNSVQNAIYVAYKYSNKEINITKNENIIIGVDNSQTCDLKIGDNVVEINNDEVTNFSSLEEILAKYDINDVLNIMVIRKGHEKTIKCHMVKDDNSKIIGIYIVNNPTFDVNKNIKLSFAGSEGGSSGGMMMALGIYNIINEEDIVKGRKIAGTGTISADGTVGEIGGMAYKIMGAAKNKVDVVLVPSANYDEAIKTKEKYKYKMEIVSISTFMDAVNYLKG